VIVRLFSRGQDVRSGHHREGVAVTTSVVEERAGWTVDALLALRRLSAL